MVMKLRTIQRLCWGGKRVRPGHSLRSIVTCAAVRCSLLLAIDDQAVYGFAAAMSRRFRMCKMTGQLV